METLSDNVDTRKTWKETHTQERGQRTSMKHEGNFKQGISRLLPLQKAIFLFQLMPNVALQAKQYQFASSVL